MNDFELANNSYSWSLRDEIEILEFIYKSKDHIVEVNTITHKLEIPHGVVYHILRHNLDAGYLNSYNGTYSMDKMYEVIVRLSPTGIEQLKKLKATVNAVKQEYVAKKTDHRANIHSIIGTYLSTFLALAALIVACNTNNDKQLDKINLSIEQTNKLLQQVLVKKADTVYITH